MRHRLRVCLGWLLAVVLAVGVYDLREEFRIDITNREPAVDAVAETELPTENLARIEPPDEAPAQLSTGRYVYTTLDGECQRVYDELYQAMTGHAASVPVSTLSEAVLDEAYKALTADHGEIFWVSGYAYTRYTQGGDVIGLDFAPNYTKTWEERESLQAQIDAKVEEILSGLPSGASDYEKAKYVFDYLAANVDYRAGAPENQNIVSVFVYGETVCQGYASAMQYLLTMMDIKAAIVTGEANGTAHAWNLVQMDGQYYYMDPTWGNSSYAGGEDKGRFVNYNYFGVTTEDLIKTHTPNDFFVLPDCTAQQDNYYVREGCYFVSWAPDALGELCAANYGKESAVISVRFASPELRAQAVQYFIREEHIGDYCEGLDSFYYIEDEQQNVLTLRFT